MTFQITWTDNAQEDLQQILDYLTKNWSEKDADNFIEKLASGCRAGLFKITFLKSLFFNSFYVYLKNNLYVKWIQN